MGVGPDDVEGTWRRLTAAGVALIERPATIVLATSILLALAAGVVRSPG